MTKSRAVVGFHHNAFVTPMHETLNGLRKQVFSTAQNNLLASVKYNCKCKRYATSNICRQCFLVNYKCMSVLQFPLAPTTATKHVDLHVMHFKIIREISLRVKLIFSFLFRM